MTEPMSAQTEVVWTEESCKLALKADGEPYTAVTVYTTKVDGHTVRVRKFHEPVVVEYHPTQIAQFKENGYEAPDLVEFNYIGIARCHETKEFHVFGMEQLDVSGFLIRPVDGDWLPMKVGVTTFDPRQRDTAMWIAIWGPELAAENMSDADIYSALGKQEEAQACPKLWIRRQQGVDLQRLERKPLRRQKRSQRRRGKRTEETGSKESAVAATATAVS